MSARTMRTTGAGLGLVAALLLSGCGGGGEEPAAPESAASETAGVQNRTPEPGAEEPSVLPGATSNGEDAPDEQSSPSSSEAAGESSESFGGAEPGPNDVAGNGVVAPSPSPAVEGDGREFGGFVDQSTVDRSSATEVAIEAMRGLSVWDTTQDVKPGDAAERVDSLVTEEALERGAGGPGKWTPLWWRQAMAAQAWSSADTELAPVGTDAQPPEGVELVTVEVRWQWHAADGEVVPEGDSHSCTVAVEEVEGQQTVTAFDCQNEIAEAEDMSA